jgi:hypothetical protein
MLLKMEVGSKIVRLSKDCQQHVDSKMEKTWRIVKRMDC